MKKSVQFLVVFLACLLLVEIGSVLVLSITRKKQDLGALGFWNDIYITRLFAPKLPIPPSASFVGNVDSDFDPAWNEFTHLDPVLGWRQYPNRAISHFGKFVYFTQANGFIPTSKEGENEFAKIKSKDVFRVIFLSSSAGIGWGSTSYTTSIPALLRKRIESAYPNRKIELINASVVSYDTAQEFLLLESELLAYSPDLVILYTGYVDFSSSVFGLENSDSSLERPRMGLSQFFLQADTSAVNAAKVFLFSLAIRLRYFLSHFAFCKLWVWKFSPQPLAAIRGYNPLANVKLKENLGQIIDSSLRNKFNLAIFLQPALGTDGNTAYLANESRASPYSIEERKKYLNALISFYSRAAVDLSELSAKYKNEKSRCVIDISRIEALHQDRIFVDHVHTNAIGNEMVSDLMFKNLSNCRLLPTP